MRPEGQIFADQKNDRVMSRKTERMKLDKGKSSHVGSILSDLMIETANRVRHHRPDIAERNEYCSNVERQHIKFKSR